MPELILHQLGEKDEIAVCSLEERCFTDPWTKGMIHDALTNPRDLYFGAFDGDQLVAYAGMYVVLDCADITNIAVDPCYRRIGLGSGMLEKIIEISREQNCCIINLEVRRGNLPAIALYKKYGFKAVGERPNYYENPREDAILMTLEL